MMNNIKILFFLMIFLNTSSIIAQDDSIIFDDNTKETKKLSEKVFFGGSFGIQFGTVTLINVNPIVGYRFFPFLEAGVSVSYTYYQNNVYDFNYSYYGGAVFARYIPVKQFFVQAEFEMLNVRKYYTTGLSNERFLVPGVLVGGGYRQMFGKRFGTQFTFLYNITHLPETPYANPIFRVEFIF